MAEMPALLSDVPTPGSAGALNDFLLAVRGDTLGRGSFAADAPPAERPLGGPLKRALDLVVAATALVVFMPLALVIALMILLTMGRPILFAHPRIGFRRKVFNCYKFRSMVRDPEAMLERHLAANPGAAREWRETQKLRNDPRVTFVGRMLRKSSLDELPQLISVLRGEMSCVGPRPVVDDELDRYGAKVALYLATRPGMTGLWQVSGRTSLDYAQRVALDETYVRSWSLWVDLKILVTTIFVVLKFNEAA